jgi:hypothetical protein
MERDGLLMDEEVLEVLRCLGTYQILEPHHPARSGKEPVRHIAFDGNVHYRRVRRFAGEALCSARSISRSGGRKVNEEPTCRACLDVARRLTEVPPTLAHAPSEHQLSLFDLLAPEIA